MRLGKTKHVGRGIDLGQFVIGAVAEEMRLRVFRLQFGKLRPFADDHLAAGQVEVEEGAQILFNGDAADAKEYRAGEAEVLALIRAEMVGVDAARPWPQLVEAARRKIIGKRLGGDQRALAGIVEIAQPAIGPAFRHRQAGARYSGKRVW